MIGKPRSQFGSEVAGSQALCHVPPRYWQRRPLNNIRASRNSAPSPSTIAAAADRRQWRRTFAARRLQQLLGSTSTQVLLTPVMANPPYDPVKDFSTLAGSPLGKRDDRCAICGPNATLRA